MICINVLGRGERINERKKEIDKYRIGNYMKKCEIILKSQSLINDPNGLNLLKLIGTVSENVPINAITHFGVLHNQRYKLRYPNTPAGGPLLR